MKLIIVLLSNLCFWSCRQIENNTIQNQQQVTTSTNSPDTISYEQIKKNIADKRKQFAVKYSNTLTQKESIEEITTYWVNTVSNDLYSKWQNTPWDFNGTTTRPQQGTIACGYFVTTILQDMDLKIKRVKLSVCASSEMMKILTPRAKDQEFKQPGLC